MLDILSLVICAMMAYWCYSIAKRNGRDRMWAILWGIFGGLLAVIIYAIIGPTTEVKIQRAKDLLNKQNK